MGTKPLMPSFLRAALKEADHLEMCLKAFLPAADALTDTILPVLFFFKLDFVRPDWVLTFVPLKTDTLARLPLAMTDFFMAIFFMPIAIFIFFMDIFMAMAFIDIFIFIAILSVF